MKQAATKLTKATKTASKTQFNLASKSSKTSSVKAVKTITDVGLKTEKKTSPAVSQNKKLKEKLVKKVIAFPKSKTSKSAPVVLPQKDKLKKNSPLVSAKSKTVAQKSKIGEQQLKTQSLSVSKKSEKKSSVPIKKQKLQAKVISPAVSDSKSKNKIRKTNATAPVAEQKLKKEKSAPIVTLQKSKRTKKVAEVSPTAKIAGKISKNNLFIAINKIGVIKKKINLSDEKTDQKLEKAALTVPVESLKEISIGAGSDTKIASRQIKPKKLKPIGAAVFRGKKERYDFQVYPLDAEIIDVPAIYIISKRKTDKQKRGHHALICIGETDSISNEIKRHRKGKCVKKHEANVISILPEANEKKRLKIETDLKAAHHVVCNLE